MSKLTPIIGIYKITSPTNKIYIGQSWDIVKRFKVYKRGEYTKQTKLFNSFKRHGWVNHIFEVIHELPTDVEQSVLDNYEILYMQQNVDCGIELLNMRGGGSRGKHSEETKVKMVKIRFANGSYAHTDETKRKISASLVGNKYAAGGKWWIGRFHSLDAKVKMSEAKKGKPGWMKGKKLSEETKRKISKSQKGNSTWLGRKHSEETKKRIGDLSRGRRHDKQALAKITAASTGENNPRAKLTDDKVREIRSKYVRGIYDSIKLAKEYGVSSGLIRGIVNNKVWTHIM